MNAYEIYDGAVENAEIAGLDDSEMTAEYFDDYAFNAMDVALGSGVAEQIAAAYAAWIACDNKCDNEHWHIVEKPLSEIQVR